MNNNILTEVLIAGKYPLYQSKFNRVYGSGYKFEGREQFKEELQRFFPSNLTPDNWKYDNLIPSHLKGKRFNKKEFAEQLRRFLEESRKNAFLFMYNSLGGLGKFGLHPVLEDFVSEDIQKEFGLANFMQCQGNIRGISIGSPIASYKQAINRFTTKVHSLQDNQLYILTSQMNTGNDCLAGVAPILFDQELKERFPEDALILARKYLPVAQMNAENYKETNLAKLWQENFDKLKREYKI